MQRTSERACRRRDSNGSNVAKGETVRQPERETHSDRQSSQLQCCDRTPTDTARGADIAGDISGSATPNSLLGSQQARHSPPCQSPPACHSFSTRSRTRSLSPYYLPSSVRPFIWTDRWSISPFLSSLFTSPLSPAKEGGRRERASERT